MFVRSLITDAGRGGPREILTHSQRVCRLYKKAYRTTESWALERYTFRCVTSPLDNTLFAMYVCQVQRGCAESQVR